MAEAGRSLESLLDNIIIWGERLARFIDRASEEEFSGSELLQAGASKCIEAIGEAAGEIERRYPDFAAAHRELSLREAYRARNRLSHGYDTIDWRLLWTTATHHVPVLLEAVTAVRGDIGAR